MKFALKLPEEKQIVNPSEMITWEPPDIYPQILVYFQKLKTHTKLGHRLKANFMNNLQVIQCQKQSQQWEEDV